MKTIVEFAKCFANDTRLQIIQLLAAKELCVCELESLTGLTQANISQHLRLLFNNELVDKRRDGQLIYYSLNKEVFQKRITELCLWVDDNGSLRNKISDLEKDEKILECKNCKR